MHDEEFVKCVSGGFTTNHLVSTKTKKTKCGLKWRRGSPRARHVWIPMAVYFNAGKDCKICYKKSK